jgi:hypothetical protein
MTEYELKRRAELESKGYRFKDVEWRPEWSVVDFDVRNVKFNPEPHLLVEWESCFGYCYGNNDNKFYAIRDEREENENIEFDGMTLMDTISNLSVEDYIKWVKIVWKK